MCTPQFPYGLVAAPFFFIGSVLWVVVPCLGLNGDELTAYGVAVGAASCFLVDFVMLLMTRGDGIALLMGAYVVYGVACIGDVIAAGVDLVGGDSFWVGLLANISYTLSGAMAMMVWIPRKKWLELIGATAFCLGGAVYLFTDSWEWDILGASLFMVDASINILQLMLPFIQRCRKQPQVQYIGDVEETSEPPTNASLKIDEESPLRETSLDSATLSAVDDN